MIEHVLGLDLSMTAPGVGDLARHPSGLIVPAARTEGGRSPSSPNVAQRAAQIRNLRARCVPPAAWRDEHDRAHRVVLAVVEGPSYGSMTYRTKDGEQRPLPGVWDRGGLYWAVIMLLLHRGVPVALTPPKTLKKWATGNGNATKPRMRWAAGELWPEALIRDDNAADGLLAASAGAHRLGWPLPVPPLELAERVPQLDAMTWPADTPARESAP